MGHTTIRRLLAPLIFCNSIRTEDKAGLSFKTLLAFVCLTLSLSVSGGPIEYTVTGEMTGTFTFDPTTNTYANVSLIVPSLLFQSPVRWTLSEATVLSNSSFISVTTSYADSEQLVLGDDNFNFFSLSLTFDPFLSQSQSSQVSWVQSEVPAGNSFGTATATPTSTPSAPTIDSIAPGNGEAIITFTPGDDNGSPITGYRYIKDDGSVTSTILGSTEEHQPGTEFGGNGIALDAAGNIYTSSRYSNNVLKITPDGTSSIFGVTGDGPPGAIALDAAGNVYTANSNDVSKITPDGTSTSLGPTGGSPSAIAVDAVGNVYAAITVDGECYDWGCNLYCPVSKITPGGTSTILGENAGCYSFDNDIAVDAAGNVYTTGGDKYLLKYTSQPYPTPFGTTGEDPVGIALDSAGNIYTANYGSDNVSKITPDGTSIIFGATGDGPVAIALDAAGNVYTANGGVSKITLDGTSTIFEPTGSFVFDIAVDAAGNVYTEGADNVSKITDSSTATFAATGDASPITITGLSNGTDYLISLIAVNDAGESAASNSVSVTLAATAPGAPQIDGIVPSNGQASISVSVADDGGSLITGYTALCGSSGLSDIFTTNSPTSPIILPELTNGVTYLCVVSAINDIGTSVTSLSAPFAPAPTAPDAPAITSITAGDGQAIVTFTPGADNGSPITGYRGWCTSDFSNFFRTNSPTSPIIISGLTNGVGYICSVKATNDAGLGVGAGGFVTPEVDTDGDGVNDLLDNCVSIANPDQTPSAINPNCGEVCVTSGCAGPICKNH